MKNKIDLSVLVIIGIMSIPVVVYAPVVVPEGEETTLEGMVLIFGGEFEMGSNNMPSEQTAHTLHLGAFYMDQHEVTKRFRLALNLFRRMQISISVSVV